MKVQFINSPLFFAGTTNTKAIANNKKITAISDYDDVVVTYTSVSNIPLPEDA